MIKEKQYIENKSSSFSSEGDPSAGDDNQMIKTPDNNSGELHHDLDRIIKTESDMTALIDNAGGDVADNKSGVGGSASSNTSPGSSNTDQKQQLMSNDICLSQIKHEDASNNSGIKVEDNNTTSTTTTTVESDFESCDRVVLSSMSSGSGGPSDLIDGSGGVQPLMSNVLGANSAGNKQSNATSGNMDAQQQQYMQQQSQIFVFSTSLANKSAESVLAGHYPTIIAYHCAQPRTKKFLEKHPLKVNQFNRQNPGQWMNNVVASQQQMKHQQQLNKGMAPHGGQPKYGGGTPYSRAMKNSNSPSGASMENPMMQQQPGARMPMWNHHQGNNINDSGPQQLQHPSNHNMMGSICGPGNNSIMGMSNHGGGGPMGPGMLMNSNNSNQSMMGPGPGSMMNQHGNLCSMGPGSGGGMPMNGMDLDLMDHHNPHHQQHHPNPHHPSNMMDGGHRPMMGGGPHHPHHPPPHHPSGALHHRGSLGMGGPPHHHGMSDMMTMGGPNKCQPSTIDSLMSSSGGPPVSVPSGPGDSPGGHNSLASMMPSLADFDDPIGSGNSSLGATSHHSLTGVQVPDENLTPQQRQHREEQQATLRKLQLVLFPENSNGGGGSSQQQPPPVTSSSSSVGGPLDNCSGSGGMDDLMPSIDDDLDVDAVVTAAAATNSAGDLLLPPKTPTSCSSDWPKSMFGNEDEKKKDNGGRCGPPPSYHQTVARSASVPIVSVPSCSPNSPLAGNGTGVTNTNLSLPSPRTCSALNSPAGGRPSSNMSPTAVRSPGSSGSRLQSSNPGTPVHMSPGHNSCSSMKQQKGPMSNEFSPSSNIATPGQPSGGGQQSPDGLFCHNNKQLSKRGDEPNLMPVPSPQHIQYLNTFDGQELTIQKQPNTGLKDSSSSTTTTTSTMSPSVPTSQNNMDMIMTDSNMKSYNIVRPGDMPLNPSAAAAAAVAAGLQTSQQQPMKHFDPISSLAQMNQQLANNVAGGGSSPIVNHGGGVPSLHHPGGPGHHHPGGGMMSPFGGGGGPPMHLMAGNSDPMCGPMGMGSGGMHDSGMGGPPGSGGRMMYGPGPGIGQGPPPPGPNGGGMSMGPGGGLPMGMPPIGGGRNGGMMMNSCVSGGPLSPKSSSMMQQQQYQQQQQQRLMPRIPAGGGPGGLYNGGANIQVKPSAPNTIQYLPNNSRGGGPRGAPPPPQNQQQQQPGLDFLQRFSGGPGNGNPLSNLDGKVPSHNLQYFPNSGSGGYNSSNGGAGINDMMCGSSGPPGGGGMGGMPPGGPNNSRGMMRGNSAGMIRLGSGNSGMGMSGSNYNGGPSDNMFGGGGPLHHPQQQMMMMGGGSGGPPPQQHKGGGMMGGPGPPDATQPLPPSMGGGGGPGPGGGPVGFRGGPPAANSFIGPTTADPNYAQQFHNFQQQLYATNTRGGGGGGGPSGPGGGGPQQFFVSK